MVAAISLLIGGSAWAQTAGDAHRRADGSRVQAANAEWRRLPQSEINCVDHALRARRSSVWSAIQQGINPSDAPVAAARAACRNERQAPKQAAAVAAVRPVSHGNVNDAPTAEYWSYDGSVLNSIAEGGSVKFFYVKPSPALKAEGAKFGTILFEGKLADQKYVGTAYSFEGGCGRRSFQASGAIVDDNRRLELLGHRPRLDKSCKVVSSELENLTFARVDTAFAAAGQTAVDKAATDKAGLDKAAAAKAAADKAAADKVAADKAASDKVAADKAAAAEKAAAEQGASDNAAAEKVAAEKAAADNAEKAAAAKLAAEQAAASKAAADRVAAEKAAAEKTAAEKAAVEKTAAEKATTGQAGPHQAAVDTARADAERAKAEAIKAQADADRARREAEKAIADVGVALAAAESKVSFIYGLLTGLALVGWGGAAFFVIYRRKIAGRAHGVTPEYGGDKRGEVELLVAKVLGEQRRATKKAPKPPAKQPELV
jgi:chemotaxis protein histidine kinase CheA